MGSQSSQEEASKSEATRPQERSNDSLILFIVFIALLTLASQAPVPVVGFPVAKDLFPNTPSARTVELLRNEFPLFVDDDMEAVIIECESCDDVANTAFARRSLQRLEQWANEVNASSPMTFLNWTDHLRYSQSPDYRLTGISPYLSTSRKATVFALLLEFHMIQNTPMMHNYVVNKVNETVQRVANEKMKENQAYMDSLDAGQLAYMQKLEQQRERHELWKHVNMIESANGNQSFIRAKMREFAALAEELNAEGQRDPAGPFTVVPMGPLMMFHDVNVSTAKDVTNSLWIFILAIFIFVWHMGSVRMVFFPVLGMTVSTIVFLSFLNLFVVHFQLQVVPPVCPLAGFWSVALSIDYALFMLSRYQQEMKKGKSAHEAIVTMKNTSGRVVLISGGVLMLFYFVTVIYPGMGWPAIGIGSILAIGGNVFTATCLLPSVLTLWSDYFPVAEDPMRTGESWKSVVWENYAHAVTGPSGRIIALSVTCLGLLAVVGFGLPSFHASAQASLLSPRDSEQPAIVDRYFHDFPDATMNPTILVVKTPEGCDIYSTCYFNQLNVFVDDLLRDLSAPPFNLSARNIASMSFLPIPPGNVSMQCVQRQGLCQDVCCLDNVTAGYLLHDPLAGDVGTVYKNIRQRTTPPFGFPQHSLLLMNVPWDFSTAIMLQFTETLQDSLERATTPRPECRISDVSTLNAELPLIDTQNRFNSLFGQIIPVSAVLAAIAIGCAFKMAIAPVRMLITIILPVTAVYGLAAFVYNNGALDWLGVAALAQTEGGIFGPVIVTTVNSLLGLSLDYDLFLFHRIVELRFKGFSNDDAIREGLISSGPTITTAGLCMALAMGITLASDTPVNNQIGFILVTGVLMDTFVIRTCLVPALLALLGDRGYYPLKPPPADAGKDSINEPLLSIFGDSPGGGAAGA